MSKVVEERKFEVLALTRGKGKEVSTALTIQKRAWMEHN
jgi:hypothetical protein